MRPALVEPDHPLEILAGPQQNRNIRWRRRRSWCANRSRRPPAAWPCPFPPAPRPSGTATARQAMMTSSPMTPATTSALPAERQPEAEPGQQRRQHRQAIIEGGRFIDDDAAIGAMNIGEDGKGNSRQQAAADRQEPYSSRG